METRRPAAVSAFIKSHYRELFSVLVLLYSGLLVLLLLTDYNHTWTQPEEFNWRENILKDGGCLGFRDIRKMFDWPSFEYVPRTTRPLSSLLEIVDTKFRVWLWHYTVPHPSFSITWLLLLLVNPFLMYKLLRAVGTDRALSIIITSCYLTNPATLSLVAVNFRPSKPLANFAILLCLYIASSIRRRSIDSTEILQSPRIKPERGFYILCVIMLVSFFFDETALVSYVAVPLFFPKVVFKGLKRIITYAVLPVVTGLCYFKLFPLLSSLSGYPSISIARVVEGSQSIQNQIGPAVNAAGMPGALVMKAWGIITDDLFTNIKIFLSDSTGLVNPALSDSPLYKVLWLCVAALLLVLAALTAVKIARHREKCRAVVPRHPYPFCIASVAALSAVTVFANILLHVVDNHVWGLHWLSTFWAIFFYLAVACLMNKARFNHLLVFCTAVFIASASYYNFIHVNNAFKRFFYYRGFEIKDLWKHKINRFTIPVEKGSAYYRQTVSLWKEHAKRAEFRHVPTELYYLVHDLRLIRPGTTYTHKFSVFDGTVTAFSLVRPNQPPDDWFIVLPEK